MSESLKSSPPGSGSSAATGIGGGAKSGTAPVVSGAQPKATPYEVFSNQPSEIVIGIVGALGANNSKVCRMIADRLEDYQYASEFIKISTVLIPSLTGTSNIPLDNKFERAKALIDLGNQIRGTSGTNSALAIAAAAEIARRRAEADIALKNDSVRRVAYIVSSLKHPDEVGEFRKIYGVGFYLFAVHTDRARRIKYLQGDKSNVPARGMTEEQAVGLIQRDEHEDDEAGQHTRETFHLADFFLADENNDDKLRNSVYRCMDLIFGNPNITPTFEEFAMFMAFTSALRSADLSRQVGAVITRGREILSMGANDCPCPGGGLYWPDFVGDRIDDAPRGRDYKRGYESNSVEKAKLIDEILDKLKPIDRDAARKQLEDGRIKDITEYGRVVHAEMEAMLACARSNISCVGAALHCTTFPCHNCAKHIIAAGIQRVIYVEPYPKSKAIEFHDEAVTTEFGCSDSKRVRFEPFIGVGSRQFFNLFSMAAGYGRAIDRKADDGSVASWNSATARPRLQLLPVSHREFEVSAGVFSNQLKKKFEAINQEASNERL